MSSLPGALATGPQRLERNRPGCSIALTTLVQARTLALQSPVTTAPGNDCLT